MATPKTQTVPSLRAMCMMRVAGLSDPEAREELRRALNRGWFAVKIGVHEFQAYTADIRAWVQNHPATVETLVLEADSRRFVGGWIQYVEHFCEDLSPVDSESNDSGRTYKSLWDCIETRLRAKSPAERKMELAKLAEQITDRSDFSADFETSRQISWMQL